MGVACDLIFKGGLLKMEKLRCSLLPVLLFAYVCCVKYTVTGQTTCNVVGQPSCICDTPDGRIDLTSIANNDGTPRCSKISPIIDTFYYIYRFKNIRGETFDRYKYSYNPCYGFQTGTNGCGINGPVNAVSL